NDDRGYGIRIDGSSFFHLTGTGDPDVEYGFDVSASRTGPDYSGSGVPVGGLSTDYEIDHLEVHHTGFAGFVLKTESRCDGSANLGSFVQRNTRVHHTYVHDTGGEAFYVGSTGYGGREFDCDGTPTTLYPHEHDGVWLHDNLIENTGWDGLQVGVTPANCEVYRNVIVGVGRDAPDPVQTRGIQIGGASACRIYDNYLADGPTIGIFVLGAGDTLVQNNVVVDFAEDGIYGNDQQNDAIAGASYVFVHNTVVRSGDTAVSLFGTRTTGNVVANNLLVGSAGSALGVGNEVDALQQGNLEFASPDDVGFVEAAADDYHLTSESAARDQGEPVSGVEVATDRDGVPRDDEPDVGAYEYTDAPPPDGGAPGPGDAGTTPPGPSSTAATADDGGCSCRVGAAASGVPLGAAGLLLLLVLRRSRRTSRPPRTRALR
ncbi:MAG: right-handed parallel beta-helix repeat-containing protein, partial [Deltaproteobacteria bacterium]|nr:right-handed parallel beta-helix repeat-containing protein [Deltaproteobacteria bacterium]MBW2532308.1 right-handed parallel beta-helix repeat-containing protein [Deltaproteobacteria bacterium]